jgi:hypothetical protein
LTWRGVVASWRALTRGQVLAAFLFGCGYFVYEQGSILLLMLSTPHFSGRPILLTVNFVQDVVAAFALLACVAVAERATGTATRQAAYLVAVVVSAAIVGPLEMVPRATTFLVHAPGAEEEDFVERLADAWWGGTFQWLILGGAATFVYVDRRRAHAAQATRHAAELRRAHSARRTLESRLQAMQARVEPQFLFNTLAQVRELYRADPGRGGRMLDNLIAYLRAAMPKMRDTSSTIGQELDLARAYLDIVKVRVGDRLSYVIDCASGMRDARFPPMLVLPLIDHAIARGGSGAGGSIELCVEPGARDDMARADAAADGLVTLSISHSGRGFDPETAGEDVERMRERLEALFANRATLRLEAARGTATRVILQVPPEPSQSPWTAVGS